jgi:hypothetical protein
MAACNDLLNPIRGRIKTLAIRNVVYRDDTVNRAANATDDW